MWTAASLCTFIGPLNLVGSLGDSRTQRWMTLYTFAFTAQHKGYQLGRGVSYNGASETSASFFILYIIRKRTIFPGAANHLQEKGWVAASNWTVEMEQELDALRHRMLMAAINRQLPSALEYLDKRRCTLQLTQASFMHCHKLDRKLHLWLSMHVFILIAIKQNC